MVNGDAKSRCQQENADGYGPDCFQVFIRLIMHSSVPPPTGSETHHRIVGLKFSPHRPYAPNSLCGIDQRYQSRSIAKPVLEGRFPRPPVKDGRYKGNSRSLTSIRGKRGSVRDNNSGQVLGRKQVEAE